ncbi:MAG: hypothetical protein ACK56F_12805, partial [bacterium]
NYPRRRGATKAPGPNVRKPGITPGGAMAGRTWSFLPGPFLRTTAITGRPPRKAYPFLRIAAITAGIYLRTLDRLHVPPGAVSSREVQGGGPRPRDALTATPLAMQGSFPGPFLRTTAITGCPPRKAHPFLRIAAITAG